MTRNRVFTLLLIKLANFYLVMGGSGLGPPNTTVLYIFVKLLKSFLFLMSSFQGIVCKAKQNVAKTWKCLEKKTFLRSYNSCCGNKAAFHLIGIVSEMKKKVTAVTKYVKRCAQKYAKRSTRTFQHSAGTSITIFSTVYRKTPLCSWKVKRIIDQTPILYTVYSIHIWSFLITPAVVPKSIVGHS